MRPLLILLAAVLLGGADEQTLLDWSRVADVAAVSVSDAEASAAKNGAALRVRMFHAKEWPGLTLKPAGGSWDLSSRTRIAVDVVNAGKTAAILRLRVDSGESDGTLNCNNSTLPLEAGARGTLVVEFVRRIPAPDGGKLFGMNGYPGGRQQTIDPARGTQLTLFVDHPPEDHEFEIGPIRAAGSYTPPPAGNPPGA